MTKQAEHFGAEFKYGEVVKVELNQQPLRLHTRDEVIETRTLIIATG
jgi:thioredoxin reductase